MYQTSLDDTFPMKVARMHFPFRASLVLLSIGIGAWAITAPVSDWVIAGPFGGTATTVALDAKSDGVVLAGGRNSLLFRSRNGGDKWDLLDFPKRHLSEVTSILVDPADSLHYQAGMISADGGGLFDSRDAGKTWAVVSDIRDFGVRALTVAPSKPSRFVAGTAHGVLVSDDSGKTWTRISDPQNLEMQSVTAVAVDSTNPDIMYAGTSHLPWKTLDGGKTWQSIHTGMIDDSDVFSIYVDPANPSDVFASACSGIYSTTNRGDQWRKLLGIPNTSRRTHVVRKDSSGVIYAGTTMGLFKSPNQGANWKSLTDAQVNWMTFDPAHPGSLYLAIENEGVGKSVNGGDTMQLMNHGFVDRTISSVAQSGTKLLALETQLGETSGIFVSGDRGESWSQLGNVKGLAGVHLTAIVGMPSEDRILLAASRRQMYKSIDAGTTWKAIPVRVVTPAPPVPETKTSVVRRPAVRGKQPVKRAVARKPVEKIRTVSLSEISGLYTIKRGAKDVLFAATDLGLLMTGDAGERWTLADIPASMAVSGLYAAPDNDGRLVARASAGLYESKDFGDHWAPLSFPLPSSDVNEVALPATSSLPILVATRLGLYSSPDGGAKWFANLGGIPASTVNSVLFGTDQTAYAVEYGRLYETKDAGASWTTAPSALPATRIRQLWMPDLSTNRLYGITSDLGVLYRN
jgi:photosystem II stability/assembly factor-like uncharacterized protein